MQTTSVGAEAAPRVVATIEGMCAICRQPVLSVTGLTDGVLLPMQGRWSVLTHRACWERLAARTEAVRHQPSAGDPEVAT